MSNVHLSVYFIGRELSGKELDPASCEKAPGGEWKLSSQPIGMGDRQKKLGQGKAIQN